MLTRLALCLTHREDIHIINKNTPLPPTELITPIFLETLFLNSFFQKKKRKGPNQVQTDAHAYTCLIPIVTYNRSHALPALKII